MARDEISGSRISGNHMESDELQLRGNNANADAPEEIGIPLDCSVADPNAFDDDDAYRSDFDIESIVSDVKE